MAIKQRLGEFCRTGKSFVLWNVFVFYILYVHSNAQGQ